MNDFYRRYTFSLPLVALALAATMIMGCGSDNTSSQPVYPVTGLTSCQGSCPTPDLVQTSMGCLPQAGCSACMGSNNGTCMAGIATTQPGYTGQYGVGAYPYGSTPYGNGYGYSYNPGFDDHHHHDHDHDGW